MLSSTECMAIATSVDTIAVVVKRIIEYIMMLSCPDTNYLYYYRRRAAKICPQNLTNL